MSRAARGLVLIDIRQGFDAPGRGLRNTPEAETNVARLLAHARTAGWGIVHVRHVPVQHAAALARLHGAVATVPSTDAILALG